MKRPALLLMLLVGCNQPKQETKAPDPPKYFEVDPANAAIVTGTVTFKGKPPAAKRISMDAEAECQALHKKPVFEDRVLVSKGGHLANAFIYIKEGLEGKTFAPVQHAVVMDQRGCQFVPRVLALRTGQTFTVKNSDPVSHNIHPVAQNNRDWNQQQPPQSPDLQRRFARSEVMIPVKCNIHNWMRAYIGVLDHPFFAVTDANGEFIIEGLPKGEYTLAAWHEVFGEQTRKLSVTTAETIRIEGLTFSQP